ncbi:MAG: nicotinate-nicotinamide nucleotide adenylyltransferase, partial [Longimicrobiales bacterium]
TVDTLRDLAARDPGTRWTLLMGADQYEEFGTWREPHEIRRLARVAVLMRGGRHGGAADSLAAERIGGAADSPAAKRIGAADSQLHAPASREMNSGDIALVVTRIDVSATAVRRRVAAGLSIRYLVPPAVEEFIFEQQLYTRNGTPVTG